MKYLIPFLLLSTAALADEQRVTGKADLVRIVQLAQDLEEVTMKLNTIDAAPGGKIYFQLAVPKGPCVKPAGPAVNVGGCWLNFDLTVTGAFVTSIKTDLQAKRDAIRSDLRNLGVNTQ